MAQKIYDVLKQEHREVKQMLKQMTKEAPSSAQVEDLYEALASHTKAEEQTLYQDLMQKKQTHELVLEGIEEHHVADMILQEIRQMEPDDEKCMAKMKVLKENVEHHIQEEEEQMFPKAKKSMGDQWAETMAQQFERTEEQLRQQMH